MTAQPLHYRWTRREFLRAAEAEVFDGRVELVEGEVWPVVLGRWHGRVTMRLARLLASGGVVVTQESLVTGESLPDPDLWTCPAGAREADRVSGRVSRWAPADVLLVVEVSDETALADLDLKRRLYGDAGYAVYWVITRNAVFEHTEPDGEGYRTLVRHRRGDELRLPYADTTVPVDTIVAED